MLIDLYCRVVDNLGDIGVCWRLAADLAGRGHAVRLLTDDASALEWMAPGGCSGVTVLDFDAAIAPGDAVVEAFGCDPPQHVVDRIGRQPWINLEHLSAEPYVERSHGLPSPRADGRRKWFFFPGFTPRTGGLLREPGLLQRRDAFDRGAWLARHGWAPRAGERVAVVFCYDAVAAVVDALGDVPTLLLLAGGAGVERPPPHGRTIALPRLAQRDFDAVLWSADIAFVRGEDSLVRAMWAGVPFVWQAYRQHDGAHVAKVEALLATLPPCPGVAPLWRAWNGIAGAAPVAWPGPAAWRAAALAGRAALALQPDLTTRLLAFIAAVAP